MTKETKSKRSWLIVTGRIIFAIVALVIVVKSVQFRDQLVKGDESYTIIKTNDVSYSVTNAAGVEQTIARDNPDYKFSIGAISLAKNIRPKPAIIGMAIFAIVPLFLTMRWRWLLDVQGIHLPFKTVMKLTYAGSLLNFFLIGTTGGDFVKAYWLGQFTPKRTESFISVFIDRLIGVSVLILMAAVLVVIMWRDPQVAKISKGVGILVVAMAAAITIIFSQRIRKLIRFESWKHKLPLSHIIDKIDQSLIAYRQASGTMIKVAGVTLLLQLAASVASYFLGQAIQIEAGIFYYLLYVPLAFFIGSIPVSIFWGLGLLEGAYVAFFAGSGFASVTQAAMLAMAVRLMQLFWSLPGSIAIALGFGEKKLTTN